MNWNDRNITITNATDLSGMPRALPACKTLNASGCTSLQALPDLPDCKTLDAIGCTALQALPELPACKTLYASGCTSLQVLPDLPDCERLGTSDCTALQALPDLPACGMLDASGCTALSFPAPTDKQSDNLKNVANHALEYGSLKMDRVHTCDTTHCIAGWACFLDNTGLEEKLGWERAGAQLLGIEARRYFYEGNQVATEFLKRYL